MSETPTAVTVVRSHSWYVYAVSPEGYWAVGSGLTSQALARAVARKTGLPLIPWSKTNNTGLGRYLGDWSNRSAA